MSANANTEGAISADLARVLAHIDGQREAYVARLIEYVRHPSISAQNIGIREVAAMLVRC
jgi:hypothetical protein